MKPKINRPSLALRLLILLVLTYLLGENSSASLSETMYALAGVFVLYFCIHFLLMQHSFLRVSLKSLLLYLLFFCFGLLRFTFFKAPNISNTPPQFTACDSCVRIAEFTEGKVEEGRYSPLVFTLNEVLTRQEKYPSNEKIMVVYFQDSNELTLQVGDVISFKKPLKPIANNSNPGAFDGKKYWSNKGIRRQLFLRSDESIKVGHNSQWKHKFSIWRTKLSSAFENVLAPKEAGIAKALVLGDKSSLDKSVKDDFTAAGAMHVLAVSGLHVGILLFCLQFCFQKIYFLRKKKLYFVVALIVLWLYALLTGASPSVVRATTMFTFLVIGKMRGHGMFSMEVLLSTAFLMLLISPAYLFDIGFQLSFSAMFAIALFFEGIQRIFYFRQKILRKIWEGTALCFAAQIGTLPLSLYYFHQFPNYFLLTNLVLLILAFAAMFSGLVFLLTYFIPYMSAVTGMAVKMSFLSLSNTMEWIADLPYALTQGIQLSAWMVFLAYLACFMIHLSIKSGRLKLLGFPGIVLLGIVLNVTLQREKNLRQSRMFMLEARGPAVLYSQDAKHCFIYEKGNERLRKELDFIAKSYQQSYGGEPVFYPLEGEVIQFENLRIGVNTDSLFYQLAKEYGYFTLHEKIEKCLEIRLP